MPRYFIDLHDGSNHVRDKEGFEEPDIDAAQKRVIGIMRKLGSSFEPGEGHQHCTVAVRDESGAVLLRARLALDLDWRE